MLSEYYDVIASSDFRTFEFVSTGVKGNIKKIVLYTEIYFKEVYNLGFGDKDEHTGFIDDSIITNNGDSQKVLTTVAATLYTFFNNHVGATVIAAGVTQARTRLYRIGITNNLHLIVNDFIVLGLRDIEWEPSRKNIDYTAYLVRKKS